MRSIRWLSLPLTAVLLVLCRCGGGVGGGSGSIVQPPMTLRYSASAAVYTLGTPIAANDPMSSGGTVSSYTVSPDLPEGLSMDEDTGIISGTPTDVTAMASYKVTASNSVGSATATLTITVNAGASGVEFIPNMDQFITPLAPAGSQFQPLVTPLLVNGKPWLAGQAVSSTVSPDGKTLLVLTSGFNRVVTDGEVQNPDGSYFNWKDSQEYVFIYDISTGAPVFKQAVTIPNSYSGIAWDPIERAVAGETRNNAFYVSSGMGDYPFAGPPFTTPDYSNAGGDNVHIFSLSTDGTTWQEDVQQPELGLNHKAGVGIGVKPCAAGLAVSRDGQTMVVANYYNDSITVFSGGLGKWAEQGEVDLRPGKNNVSPQSGVPGGEYPYWVVVATTTNTTTSETTQWAYVSSIRDREIDVVNLAEVGGNGGEWPVTARIHVKGQPNKMTLNAAQTRLYVAEDQSDSVDVIDINANDATKQNTILETIPITAAITPELLAQYSGANTNGVALSPDETQLYVTNGNLNCVAVVALTGTDKNDRVTGLIPTGWYPDSVSVSNDGQWVYVANAKSPTGPNPDYCYSNGPPGYPNCLASNEYNPQRTKAGLQSFPTATLAAQLPALTTQVATNNRFSTAESASDKAVMSAVHKGIQHVIFVLKENRTYDEVLGDLPVGNGDPSLTQFGQATTPNLHKLAQTFVTLDDLMATAEVSYDGWSWTTGARATDVVEHQYTVQYANRGLSLDFNGFDRNVNVAIPTLASRRAANPLTPKDPDVLAGQTDVSAPDGPDNGVNTGHLWDAAMRAGLTVRNYGFFIDVTCYNINLRGITPSTTSPCFITPIPTNPASTKQIVAVPANAALAPFTDPYYRGFDTNFPDYYRYTEWARDFDANYASGGLPALSLVELGHDHTGTFGTAIEGVNTPDLMVADNDYAVGLLIQKIASSIYANNTLIFIIEDDAQDGADHVDSHRTTAYVAGAYVKQGAVVSTPYNTLDFIRTVEEVLGLSPMNLNDALARPMADIFNTTPSTWSFTAAPATILYNTQLPLPSQAAGMIVPKPTHSAKYWARVTKGMDFSDADRIDDDAFNHILWKGLMGNRPYPAGHTGKDLRQNREQLLANYRRSLKLKQAHESKTTMN
jgi:DNA-binding beta-propeller fold protein YncE